jgi:hypothetical protein
VMPRVAAGATFHSFWSTAAGWGTFTMAGGKLSLKVDHGKLACRTCVLRSAAGSAKVSLNGKPVSAKTQRQGPNAAIQFADRIELQPGGELVIEAIA